jgi:hypothetical protein
MKPITDRPEQRTSATGPGAARGSPQPRTAGGMAVRSSGRAQQKMHRVLGILALTAILLSSAACTGSTTTGSKTMSERDWRTRIVEVALPKAGCFRATYPSLRWRQVACVKAPNVREDPAPAAAPAGPGPGTPGSEGPAPATVGGSSGDDYAALRPLPLTGRISSATGEFPIVTGVANEHDMPSGLADTYTLQLNPNPFDITGPISPTPVCTGASPPCRGFQQFLYNGHTGTVGIEYFLYIPTALATACTSLRSISPYPWMSAPVPFIGPGGATYIGCTTFNPDTMFGPQPITNLHCLSLTGTATAGGLDTAKIAIGGAGCPTGSAAGDGWDSVLNLASGWIYAEFNVFGVGGGSQAVFNPGSTLEVKTTIHYGGKAAPGCYLRSNTSETNNLNLVGAPSLSTQLAPAIEFTESNILSGQMACVGADGFGETHLRTFSGLLYDFQAAGDFLLAQAGDFAVQARQVPVKPPFQNVSANQAVATQMGSTRVALCAAPTRLVVNGKSAGLADGQTLSLPSGVHVHRTGAVYLVTDQNGNSMRAAMVGPWIDVSVGLGTWPTGVRGLLANANGNPHLLQASDGTILPAPVPFGQLYRRYGDSWRVAPADSLLSVCGGKIEPGNPQKPFFASNLAPGIRDSARAICLHTGVKNPALLDACTLDVAVLGKQAATVYVGAPAPAAVGTGK